MTQLYTDHSDMVRSLAKPGDSILQSLTPEKAHLIHMAIGISGEAGEMMEAFMLQVYDHQSLDTVNVVEELGDLEFYMEGLRQGFSITREQVLESVQGELKETNGLLYAPCGMVREAGNILDYVKKYVIYNKPLNIEPIIKHMGLLEQFMEVLRKTHNIQRDDTLVANLNKLLKGKNARYASGSYSDQQAQDRADKQ